MENLKPRATSIICKLNPEWGSFGIMEDKGDYYEIRNGKGARILFKSEAVEFWEVYKR